jgi:predicted nucleic acid-binding protein
VLAELGMEILEQKFTIAELREVANLILQRSVDPGDALNAITAKKENMSIVTLDEDWQRLSDYVTAVITL